MKEEKRGGIFANYIVEEPETSPGGTDLFGDPIDFTGNRKGEKKEEEPPESSSLTGGIKVTEEHKKLVDDANKSKLRKHIRDEEFQNIKLQMEKRKLLLSAMEVAYIKELDFLYIHYMEKANRDFVKMFRKYKTRIENFINDKRSDDLITFLEKEASNTVKNVKAAQAKELKEWGQD